MEKSENEENGEKLAEIAPFTKEYLIPEKGEVYYLCKGATCAEPQKTIDGLKKLMKV